MIKEVIPVRIGTDVEGGRERRPVRKDGLQQPNGLNHSRKASDRRHYGETRRGKRPDTLKTMLETSVSTLDQSVPGLERCQSLATMWQWLGRPRTGLLPLLLRFDRQSAQPGAKSSTYRVKGPTSEHETLKLSTGYAYPGKPPGQASSQLRRRVSIVVRARESRAHGEGRQ